VTLRIFPLSTVAAIAVNATRRLVSSPSVPQCGDLQCTLCGEFSWCVMMIPALFCRWELSLLAFKIPGEVFWPYFAGGAALAIALLFLPKQEIHRAHGLDKLISFGPLLVAIAMAIFGADHLIFAKFVATIVPAWMPWRLFWAYFVGFALLAAALSLATTVCWRFAAAMLGIMLFLFVLLMHIPNWLHAPHDHTRLTFVLRDMALSFGILSFAFSRKTPAMTQRGMFSGFDVPASRVIAVTRFLVAFPVAIFGIEQFRNPAFAPGIPQDDPSVFITLPAWMPAHTVWAYATGAIFVCCAVGMTTRRYARPAAKTLGITVLALVLVAYIPLTIAKASDVASGLNYLAIHFALAGAALLLAGAIPAEWLQVTESPPRQR